MSRYGVVPTEVGLLSHATTVVTNAILQESGARAALITTRGFRDVLELRRSARADLYDLFQDAPATLIPRRRRFEITERIGADGVVVTPLAEDEISGVIGALRSARVDAVAISLVFSFLNPEHERRLGAPAASALPDVRSICRRMCCPRSRSSSARARPPSAPMLDQFSPHISSGWKRSRRPCATTAPPDGIERRHP
jgi:N-methylhydantoinase A